MNHWISKATLLAAMVACGAAAAAEDGQFFVNGELGTQTQQLSRNKEFRDGSKLKDGLGAGLRLGYVWDFSDTSWGLELGYVNLGKLKQHGTVTVSTLGPKMGPLLDVYSGKAKQATKGVVLGGNAKLRIDDHWFISARGGLFRANSEWAFHGQDATYKVRAITKHRTTNQFYAGFGTGYDFNEHVGLSFNYDYYRSKVGDGGAFGTNLFGISAEYRF